MNLLLERSPSGIVIHFGVKTEVAGYTVVLYTGECPIKVYTDTSDKIRAVGIPCEYLPPRTTIKKTYSPRCDIMGVYINEEMYKGLHSACVSSSEYKIMFYIRSGCILDSGKHVSACILKLELLDYTTNFYIHDPSCEIRENYNEMQLENQQPDTLPPAEKEVVKLQYPVVKHPGETGIILDPMKKVHRLLPMNFAPMLRCRAKNGKTKL